MIEQEISLIPFEGDTPAEQAAFYQKTVNEEFAKDEVRYSKLFEEMLPWMVLDFFTTDLMGVKYLGIVRGIGRHTTKKEFMPSEETEDGDD